MKEINYWICLSRVIPPPTKSVPFHKPPQAGSDLTADQEFIQYKRSKQTPIIIMYLWS